MIINDIPLQRLKEILASDTPLAIETTEALIARLEQAEQEANAAKGVITQHIAERSLETHRNVGIAVDEAVKAVVQLLIEDPSRRAREAEAAVARVRVALTEVQGRGERISEMPNSGSIRSQERAARGEGYLEATRLAFRALDGDGRA